MDYLLPSSFAHGEINFCDKFILPDFKKPAIQTFIFLKIIGFWIEILKNTQNIYISITSLVIEIRIVAWKFPTLFDA